MDAEAKREFLIDIRKAFAAPILLLGIYAAFTTLTFIHSGYNPTHIFIAIPILLAPYLYTRKYSAIVNEKYVEIRPAILSHYGGGRIYWKDITDAYLQSTGRFGSCTLMIETENVKSYVPIRFLKDRKEFIEELGRNGGESKVLQNVIKQLREIKTINK